MQNLDFAD